MKMRTFFVMSLTLLFSISYCMDKKEKSDGEESEDRALGVDELDRDLGASELDASPFDKYLRGMRGDTSAIRERALAKLEQRQSTHSGGKVTRSKRKPDPVLVALLEAQQEELELKQQEVAMQMESLDDAKASSKTSTRFAWVGVAIAGTSFVTATVVSITSLIISIVASSGDAPIVECVCP